MALNKTQRDNARRYRTFDPRIDEMLDPDGDGHDEEYEYDDSEDDDAEYLDDEEEPEDDEEDIDATPGRQKRNTGEKRRQLPARTGRRQDNRDEDSGDGDIDHLPARQKPNKAEQHEARLMEMVQRLALAEGVHYADLRHQATYGTPEAQAQAANKIQQLQRRASYLVSD